MTHSCHTAGMGPGKEDGVGGSSVFKKEQQQGCRQLKSMLAETLQEGFSTSRIMQSVHCNVACERERGTECRGEMW
jgi:predicted metal-binding protein